MFACIYKGCTTEGTLPGGLHVRRRAFDLNNQLLQNAIFRNESDWWKRGISLNWDVIQVSHAPFFERLICSKIVFRKGSMSVKLSIFRVKIT